MLVHLLRSRLLEVLEEGIMLSLLLAHEFQLRCRRLLLPHGATVEGGGGRSNALHQAAGVGVSESSIKASSWGSGRPCVFGRGSGKKISDASVASGTGIDLV